MSEIIDFIIELIAVISGEGRNYGKKVSSAPRLSDEEKNLVIQQMNEHLAKDPSTSSLKYAHLYLVKSKRGGIKVIALDDCYNKVISVLFDDFINLSNGEGQIDVLCP